jgi:hypothetical protein
VEAIALPSNEETKKTTCVCGVHFFLPFFCETQTHVAFVSFENAHFPAGRPISMLFKNTMIFVVYRYEW